MNKFLMLSLMSVAACGVDPDPDPHGTQQIGLSAPTELSTTISAGAQAGPALAVTCTRLLACQLCGPRHLNEQNILVEECSDGTETIVWTGSCGVDCI